MHLTAFLCIFLPLYTHLGQAHIIFAAENLVPHLLLPPIHIQLAPFFVNHFTKSRKRSKLNILHPCITRKNKKCTFFAFFFEILTSFSSLV